MILLFVCGYDVNFHRWCSSCTCSCEIPLPVSPEPHLYTHIHVFRILFTECGWPCVHWAALLHVSVGVGTDSWSLVCSHWALTVVWLSEVIVVIHETKMMLTFSQLSLITMGLQLFSSKSFRCLLMITTARCSVNAHNTHYHDSTLQSSIICTYVPTYLRTYLQYIFTYFQMCIMYLPYALTYLCGVVIHHWSLDAYVLLP